MDTCDDGRGDMTDEMYVQIVDDIFPYFTSVSDVLALVLDEKWAVIELPGDFIRVLRRSFVCDRNAVPDLAGDFEVDLAFFYLLVFHLDPGLSNVEIRWGLAVFGTFVWTSEFS